MDRAFLTEQPDVGTLILVRHGQQVWPDPATSVAADWIDPPLSTTGEAQAAAVGDHLADERVTAVYSSQLMRANQTGHAIASHHGLEVTVVDELAEIQMYRDLPPESRPSDILGRHAMAGIWQRFVHTRSWDAYPYTESSADFRHRVGRAIEACVVAHPAETVVVACHGGVINAYLADLLGLEVDVFFRPFHASVHRILFKDDKRVVEQLNGDSHLVAAGLVTH